jgi:antitoxin component of RelBE/YafQ-DinJ toxin-antitoxin module
MDKMLAIRIDAKQQAAIARTAHMLGMTISEFVRETLEQAVVARSLSTKTTHVKRRLSLKTGSRDSWARALKQRNWRS